MEIDVGFIVLIAVTIALFLLDTVPKQVTYRKLQRLLDEGRYDELVAYTDTTLVRLYYRNYELTNLKLKAYLLKGDEENARKTLDDLLSQKLPEEQRADLVVRAFNAYLGWGDAEHAHELLDEIESWKDAKYDWKKKKCQRLYDIIILGKSDHIDQMKYELRAAQGADRAWLEYYIALQYQNRGDNKNYRKYRDLAMKHDFKPESGLPPVNSTSTDLSNEKVEKTESTAKKSEKSK